MANSARARFDLRRLAPLPAPAPATYRQVELSSEGATEHAPAGMPAKARLLAIASLQPGGPSSVPLLLTVSLQKRDHPPYEPEPDTSAGFAAGLSASLGRSHPEARLRGDAPELRLLTAHGLPVVRLAYDLDGCTGTNESTAHGSMYGVMTPQGFYTFTVNAPLEEAEIARELADEMVATLRVSKLAPRLPESAGPPLDRRVGAAVSP